MCVCPIVQEYLLGKESTSRLGSVGVVLEAGLIVYFMCASIVGVYSIPPPLQRWLLPTPHDTPMTKVRGGASEDHVGVVVNPSFCRADCCQLCSAVGAELSITTSLQNTG